MIYSIQYLRFVLAMMVVTLHFFSVYNAASPIAYFTLAVDVFFVLTGFIQVLSTKSNKDPKKYISKWFKRILPIYWFMLFIGMIGILVFSIPIGREFIGSLLLVPAYSSEFNHNMEPLIISQAWTLQFDFLLYYLYFISFQFFKDDKSHYFVILVLLFVSMLSLFGLSSTIPYITILLNNMVIFLEYTFGILLGLIYVNTNLKNYKNNKLGLSLILIAIMLLLINFNIFTLEYGRGISFGIPSVILLLGVILIDVKQGHSIRLGELSYPIYISHTISVFGFATITKVLLPNVAPIVIYPFSALLAVVVGMIFLVIDKNVFQKF